jgi:hypothetical protein
VSLADVAIAIFRVNVFVGGGGWGGVRKLLCIPDSEDVSN